MSFEPLPTEGRQAAHNLAEALTNVPPNFGQEVMKAALAEVTPVSNDFYLGASYHDALAHTPKPTPGKSGTIMILGNGGFETAAQLFPKEYPILICDKNASTLFTQRVIAETIQNADTPEKFLTEMQEFAAKLKATLQSQFGPTYDTEYSSNRMQWWYQEQLRLWGADTEPKHFLADLEAYEAARKALADRPVGFRLLDLQDQSEVADFGNDLSVHNLEIVCANFTNAFSPLWGGTRAARNAAASLPFNDTAIVVHSLANSDGTNFRVSRAEALDVFFGRPEFTEVPGDT